MCKTIFRYSPYDQTLQSSTLKFFTQNFKESKPEGEVRTNARVTEFYRSHLLYNTDHRKHANVFLSRNNYLKFIET